MNNRDLSLHMNSKDRQHILDGLCMLFIDKMKNGFMVSDQILTVEDFGLPQISRLVKEMEVGAESTSVEYEVLLEEGRKLSPKSDWAQ